MKIYNIGRWIEVTYWDGDAKYFKVLPKVLSSYYYVRYFYNGKLLTKREWGKQVEGL